MWKRLVVASMCVIGTVSVAQTPQVEISLRPQFELNNHIEFGISIDPSTVPQSRESSQLSGSRTALVADVASAVETGRFSTRLNVSPTLENYSGEGGFLDQFDAQRIPANLTLTYDAAGSLPSVRVNGGAIRLERDAPIYDVWEPYVGIGIGELLSYEYRRRAFDDAEEREDYLLIDSTRHTGRAAFRVSFNDETRLDTSAQLQRETYARNLSPLLYTAIGETSDFQREDTRRNVRVALTRVVADSLLAQIGLNGLWSRSNSRFYEFQSTDATFVAFWSSEDRRWVRAQFARGWIDFDGRTFSETFGGERHPRRDRQWRAGLSSEWGLTGAISLTAAFDATQNKTNDTREVFDFLNYTQTITTVGMTARY
ncbi:MAG: hypothetical protein O3A46_09820 [Candidatus Poribacteria bacterium]|nr:hypothetical protein [Candidatus Poribacteria bacterium]